MGEVVSNITTELLALLNGVQHATDQAPMQDAGAYHHTDGWGAVGGAALRKNLSVNRWDRIEKKRTENDQKYNEIVSKV